MSVLPFWAIINPPVGKNTPLSLSRSLSLSISSKGREIIRSGIKIKHLPFGVLSLSLPVFYNHKTEREKECEALTWVRGVGWSVMVEQTKLSGLDQSFVITRREVSCHWAVIRREMRSINITVTIVSCVGQSNLHKYLNLRGLEFDQEII